MCRHTEAIQLIGIEEATAEPKTNKMLVLYGDLLPSVSAAAAAAAF